jgi:hypothetical protein
MALTQWGFIYTAPGSPETGRMDVAETAECRTVLVGVPSPEHAVAVARQLVRDGAQLIELCGGFGPVWAAPIIDAVDGAVPVGSVGYGPEAVDQVHAIFS